VAAKSRSSTRRTLPVAVVGKASVNTTLRGRLTDGSPWQQNSVSSASVTARTPSGPAAAEQAAAATLALISGRDCLTLGRAAGVSW
jgi:hypothetical protein